MRNRRCGPLRLSKQSKRTTADPPKSKGVVVPEMGVKNGGLCQKRDSVKHRRISESEGKEGKTTPG